MKKGLTDEQVLKQREQYGENVLAKTRKQTVFEKFLHQMKDPMLIMLLMAAFISGITDYIAHEPLTEVVIIVLVVFMNAVLGVFQESKAENAIDSLSKMTSTQCKVMRNGNRAFVASRDIVPGDIVLLEAGDAIPADGILLEANSLQVEESALTGESVPVDKNAADDARNRVCMGTTVVYGRGVMEVETTGMSTEMGKIANALNSAVQQTTPLQKKLNELGNRLSLLVIIICILIFILDLVKVGSFSLQVILNTFMVAVSLAVAAIPEGLATVVTIVLSIGVTRMAERNAVIRKLTAVETLGCTQVICTDKTGTLTENKMTVVRTEGNEDVLNKALCLCNDAYCNDDGSIEGEATEAALLGYAEKNDFHKKSLEAEMPRVEELPFDSKRKMMTTVHRINDHQYIQYTKGAPEVILSHCTFILDKGKVRIMKDSDRKAISETNKEMADQALRLIGVAYRNWNEKPVENNGSNVENNLIYAGVAGMIDPVRKEIIPAMKECRNAGIRPVMITGDNLDTAVAIGKSTGIIENSTQAITGTELDAMSDDELQASIEKYGVYARVKPEHKTRIVSAWQNIGNVTAMTGDGVNDAPAIRKADIGIGMGINGTDVTRNVSDMILLDDNFATIVKAVEEGRRIYDNIRKSIQFLLSSNMSEVIGIFVSSLLGFTLLNPVHLLFINLITDCFPALALAMEKGEKDIMSRNPRSADESIFSNGMGMDIAVQGTLIAGLTILSYFIGHYYDTGVMKIGSEMSPHGMTMAFLTMNMCELFHSLNCRSLKDSVFKLKTVNRYMVYSIFLSIIFVTVVLEVPFVADLFGFTSLGIKEYVTAFVIAGMIIPMIELYKRITEK